MIKPKINESAQSDLMRFRQGDPEHKLWEGTKDTGDLLRAEGHSVDARKLYEVALAIAERYAAADPNHFGWQLNLEISCEKLGNLLYEEADLVGARPLFERVVAIHQKVYGAEDSGTAAALNNLATLLYKLGDLVGARPLYERALTIWDKISPQSVDEQICDNLANLLYKLGDFAGARSLYERVVAIRDQRWSPNFVHTMIPLRKIARLVHDHGDLVGALPFYERALALSEKTKYPYAYLFTAELLGDLGVLQYDLANNLAEADARSFHLAKARSLLERALAIHEKHAIDNVHTALILNNLAITLNQHDWVDGSGNLARAQLLFKRALAIREKVLDPDHLDTAYTLHGLAITFYQQGMYADAVPCWERASRIFEKWLGPEAETTVICRSSANFMKEKIGADLLKDQNQAQLTNVVRLVDYSRPLRQRQEASQSDVENRLIPLYNETKPSPGGVVKNATKVKFDERGIPLAAPAKWPGKRYSIVPIDVFFRRLWGKYLRKGLTFEDIKRLDYTLANSMRRHFRDRLPWPKDLNLPNERKALKWAIEQFKKGNVEVLSPQQLIAVGRAFKRQEATKSRSPGKLIRLER